MQVGTDNLIAWLRLLCSHVPAVERAVLVVGSDAAVQRVEWPQSTDPTDDLYGTADLAMRTSKTITSTPTGMAADATTGMAIIAHPFAAPDGRQGAVAALVAGPAAQRSTVVQLLKWATGWLEATPLGSREAGAPLPLLDQLYAATGGRTLETTATACATALAEYLDFERVLIGLWRGDRFRLVAISHGRAIDHGNEVVQRQQTALASSGPLQSTVLLGRGADPPAERLAELHAMAQEQRRELCVVPLVARGDAVAGLVVFERARERPFTDELIELCGKLGPIVALALASVRGGPGEHVQRLTSRWRGFRRRHRLAVVAAAGLALAALLAVGGARSYRVVDDARIEGRIQRVVVAPFDGYINAAHFRAGEIVESGATVAELDTRELVLDRRHWIDKRSEYEKQHRKALAALDRAAVAIHGAQIDQAEAQVRLIDLQIDRAALAAPLTGVIIAGDLSRSLGAPVERGDVMFEVAPLGEFRLAIYVDQDEIALVRPGQSGVLALKAFPDREFAIVVLEVSPDFEEDTYSVRYRVEATIESGTTTLLPGMQGVARITIDDASYAAIYAQKLTNTVRLWAWQWLP